MSKLAYWSSFSQFIEPFAPVDEDSLDYKTSDYALARGLESNRGSQSNLGRVSMRFETVVFYRKAGKIEWRLSKPQVCDYAIDSPEDRAFLLRHKFVWDAPERAERYLHRLRELDDSPDRSFTRAFDPKFFEFEQIRTVEYSPNLERVSNPCDKHEPEHFLEKRDANGVVTKVCPACGLVASEDLFQTNQSERMFEEKREAQATSARRHHQQHGRKRSYQETEALLNTHSGEKRQKKNKKRSQALRSASRLLAAVMEKRCQVDVLLLAKDRSATHSLGDTQQSRRNALLKRFGSDDQDETLQEAIARSLSLMTDVSPRVAGILANALDLFDNSFAVIASKSYNGIKGWKSSAFACVVAALRLYDMEQSSACHLLEDFIHDGQYQYRAKKVQTVKTPRYKDLEARVQNLSLKLSWKTNVYHTLLRVLDGLCLTVFQQPLNEITSAKTAQLYLYRIRARVRVIAYWNAIVKKISPIRRERVVMACAIVYEALRNSCSATRMKHCWMPSLLEAMKELSEEEKKFKSLDEFLKQKTESYESMIFESKTEGLTDTEVNMSEISSNLLDELRLYPAYKTECRRLDRPLEPTDCSCAFQLKWLVRLFRVKEKRVDETRKLLPPIPRESVLMDEEKILPNVAPGTVAALLAKCRTGDQTDASKDELLSGRSWWMPLITSTHGKLVPCAGPPVTMAEVANLS